MEIWKNIKGYEGFYQVSNLGRVKSLKRIIKTRQGKTINKKEIILKNSLTAKGYLKVGLYNKGFSKNIYVHILVAEQFLNHKSCGHKLVVNHKDFDKLNNNVENLEIVTQRENANRKHLKSSSKYTGVCWCKNEKKWKASIKYKSKSIHIGYFNDEVLASEAYEQKLKKLTT